MLIKEKKQAMRQFLYFFWTRQGVGWGENRRNACRPRMMIGIAPLYQQFKAAAASPLPIQQAIC